MTRILRGVAASILIAFVAACNNDSPTRPSTETARFTAQLSPANEVPPVGGPHLGVCQFVFCDGGVRSVNTAVDEQVLGRLSHRRDRLPAPSEY